MKSTSFGIIKTRLFFKQCCHTVLVRIIKQIHVTDVREIVDTCYNCLGFLCQKGKKYWLMYESFKSSNIGICIGLKKIMYQSSYNL